MLINLTNHPKASWQKKQLQTAINIYGNVVDIPFPKIDSNATVEDVFLLAKMYANKIYSQLSKKNDVKNAVHIMGEFTFTYNFVLLMNKEKIETVLSTSERMVYESVKGVKQSVFNFVAFRRYNV